MSAFSQIGYPDNEYEEKETEIEKKQVLVERKERGKELKRQIHEHLDNFPFLHGPLTAGLDEALKKQKIQMQAYHGRSFVGNHCHRYLKEETYTKVCDSVLINTNTLTISSDIKMVAEKISNKFKELFRLFAKVHQHISHKKPITYEQEIKTIEFDIEQYMHYFRQSFPDTSITPKQHILECHCLDFIKKYKCGLGLMGEQGGEECHATINILKSRTYGVQREEDRITLLMNEHQTLVSPLIQQEFRSAIHKAKNQKRGF